MFAVEVTSQDTIKPSSPTPPHLQTHSLSWLDQLSPPSHVPLLLFYPPPPSPSLESLKHSLSQTLSLFPLLSGRLHNDSSQIHCGDQGVDFLETHVDSPLSHLQHQLSLQSLEDLLPCNRSCSCWGQALLAVQINTFSCGSVVIGICIAHKIADGLSLTNFVTAWAAAAASAGGGDIPRPNLGAASLFPPSEKANLALASVKWRLKPAKKLITKRFLFDEANLAALRGSSSTRVEAVAALVWRCAMRARPPAPAASRVSLAFVVVDIRGRMEPPLGANSFGNLCVYAAASEVEAGDEAAKRRTEEKLRSGIKKVDKEYLGKLQGVDGPLLAFEKGREAAREHGKSDDDVDDIDIYYFNSWARFPVYEADFGWGKPVWVGTARFFWKNLIMLMGRSGDGGMEAWVTLEEEEMVKFEKDRELVSYATCLASIAAYPLKLLVTSPK